MQKPTLVQLHSTPGVGNAIGALYQAKRGHSPLVVIGGDAGIRYHNFDAQMAGDLVAFAEPVTGSGRWWLILPRCCVYCGVRSKLPLPHP